MARLTHSRARIHPSDDLDDDVGRRRKDLCVVVRPRDGGRHPRRALARDISIEDVGQLQPRGKLGAFDQNAGDGGSHRAKSKQCDLERSMRHCSTV